MVVVVAAVAASGSNKANTTKGCAGFWRRTVGKRHSLALLHLHGAQPWGRDPCGRHRAALKVHALTVAPHMAVWGAGRRWGHARG